MTPRICVVGSANMDLLAKVPRLPRMGETLVGRYFHMGSGGKGSNQAAMAAKLGANVTMVAKLGRDPMGQMMFESYQQLGIDTQYVLWDEDHFSGVAPILVDDDGRNMIVIIPGANMALSPQDVIAAGEAIEGAPVLICQLEIPVETTLEAFRIAKGAGVTTILNPAPAAPIPAELFQLTDIIAPNETETEILTELPVGTIEEAKRAAAALSARGPQSVIITLGERGAVLLTEEGFSHVPALPVNSLDSTGAGDAFIGSLAFFVAQGMDLRKAVGKSNAVAAVSVTRIGTQVSFPSRDEVKHILES
jgi:ribokinase